MTMSRFQTAAARPAPVRSPPQPSDRVVVAGGSTRTLDLVRFAILRSDDVVLVSPRIDAALARFSECFAVEIRLRPLNEADLIEAAVLLVSTGEAESENRIVGAARRHGVPVHVADRALVSDFADAGVPGT